MLDKPKEKVKARCYLCCDHYVSNMRLTNHCNVQCPHQSSVPLQKRLTKHHPVSYILIYSVYQDFKTFFHKKLKNDLMKL